MTYERAEFPDIDVLSPDAILDDVSLKLRDAGLSPEFVAHTLDVPLARVRSLRHSTPATFADEKLQSEVQKLASAALRQAFRILEFGTSEQKLTIVKSVLSGVVRTASTGRNDEQDEMRTAFAAMLNAMTAVPRPNPRELVEINEGVVPRDVEGETTL